MIYIKLLSREYEIKNNIALVLLYIFVLVLLLCTWRVAEKYLAVINHHITFSTFFKNFVGWTPLNSFHVYKMRTEPLVSGFQLNYLEKLNLLCMKTAQE